MPKKVISYRLVDGTIPDHIEIGGLFPKNALTADMILIGISKDNADISSAIQVFDTVEDLITYMNTYLSDQTWTDAATQDTKEFIVVDAAAWLFSQLN